MPETIREWLTPLLTLLGGTGLGALIQSIRKPSSKAEDVASEAEADRALTAKFVALTERLEARLKRVEDEAEACQKDNAAREREIQDLRRELAEMRAAGEAKDREIEALNERIRRLEGQLEARDITDAAESLKTAGYAVIEKGRTTVMRPPRKPRKTQ